MDQHLRRLAAYLRLAGFDAWHRHNADDVILASLEAGGRVLLTRDQGLLKRRSITRGYSGAEHTSMRYEPCSSARSQKLLRGWMHKIAV